MRKLIAIISILLLAGCATFDTEGTRSALNLDKDTGDTVTAADFDAIDTAVTDNDSRLDTVEAVDGLIEGDGAGAYTAVDTISELETALGSADIIDSTEVSSTGDYTTKVLKTDASDKLPVDMTEAVRMENMEYPERLDMTTDTSVTTTQIFVNLVFTNQGASAEVDVTLPAVSYDLTRIIKVEEDQVVEIGPPSGEQLYLSGTGWLTADYVVDGPGTGPAFVSIVRGMNSAGAWRWYLIPALGTFTSHGGVSD